jgi:hypothetical protein
VEFLVEVSEILVPEQFAQEFIGKILSKKIKKFILTNYENLCTVGRP